MLEKFHTKFREEFLLFIEELKHSGITQALYNSTTPEETISIWEKYSSENQELFEKIRSWAAERNEYFNTCKTFTLFADEEQLDDCLLEICLILIIVKDESILCEEDINNEFGEELYFLLNQSSNKIFQAVAEYIDCNGYDTLSKENIFDFYPEE